MNRPMTPAEQARQTARHTDGRYAEMPLAEGDLEPAATPNALRVLEDRADSRSSILARRISDLTGQLHQSCLVAASAAVRRRFPDAVTLVIEDNYEGGIEWSATTADGEDVFLYDDDELIEFLYQQGTGLDMGRPSQLHQFSKGHDPSRTGTGYGWSGDISTEDGAVTRMAVDIDQMLTTNFDDEDELV